MQKVILVTGASSGLGKEIAKTLSQDNFVYVTARNVDGVEKDKNIEPLKLDVTNDKECRAVVEKIIKQKGRIDALINVAGYSVAGPSLNFHPSDFLQIINVNTIGAFRLSREVAVFMKNRGSGRIINITSLSGLVSLPNFGLYSASKFALEALGMALRYELGKDKVFVTNVAPGAIESDDGKKMPHKSAREKFWLLRLLMPMVTREKVAGRIIGLIENPHPPAHVILGNDTKIVYLLQKLLPSVVWDKLLFFVWNKK